jgi:hypothetical protein
MSLFKKLLRSLILLSQATQGQGGVVVGVREEVKVIQKPVGLNTVTLLKACSKGNRSVRFTGQSREKYS